MSRAHDRAHAIAEALAVDGLTRRLFLMPRDQFVCRIVAVPEEWNETLAWVRAEAEAEVGGCATGATAEDIADILDEATGWNDVPRRTPVAVSH